MKVADMHCDTISELLRKQRAGVTESLLENTLHMDLRRMKQGDYALQTFAMFVYLQETEHPYKECKAQYELFAREMEKNQEQISWIRSSDELKQRMAEKKMAALLSIEEGEVCEGDVEKLKEFYDLGVRMMTLVWNYDNSLSTSAVKSSLGRPRAYDGTREGLTETGMEFVECMEELGMIPDVSHMSDAGIKDLLQIAKKPFVASHSNARSLCHHPRNLTDTFLKSMGEKGCVIGVNFYSRFLDENALVSKIERIADHVLYMTNLAGMESVGLGSDFDGIDCELELKDCSKMQMLAESLRRRGMTESQIEKVFYKNVLRLYEEVL